MELKNYEVLRIAVVKFAIEDVIRTSGEEFGMSWDKNLWGDGSTF